MFMGSKGATLSKKTPMPISRDNDPTNPFKAPAPKQKANKDQMDWDDYDSKADESWYD